MKKILVFLTALSSFFLPLETKAEQIYAPKAQSLMDEIQKLYYDLGDYNQDCENDYGQAIRFRLRYNLTDLYFLEAARDNFRNACLRRDLYNLESQLNTVILKAPLSQAACQNDTADNAIKKIGRLQAKISCLRQYGEKPTASKACSDYTEQIYTEANCKEPRFEFTYEQTMESWQELKSKLKEIISGSKWEGVKNNLADLKGTEEELNDLTARANESAEAWVQNQINNVLAYSGEMFSFRWVTKTEKQKQERFGVFDTQRKNQDAEDKDSVSSTGDRSQIFAEIENSEINFLYADKLSEADLILQVRTVMDQQLAQSISKHLQDLQADYDATSIGALNISLKDMQAALKAMLDKHSSGTE